MGFWWEGDRTIYLEKDTVIFPSRALCLEYLLQFHSREKAIDIILSIKKSGKTVLSF